MVVVDTNVILRHLLDDHSALAGRVHAFFASVRRGDKQAFVSDAVVAECAYVLSGVYEVPRPAIAEALSRVLNYRGLITDRRGALQLALAEYANSKLDFVEALLLAISRTENWEVFCFDGDLKGR